MRRSFLILLLHIFPITLKINLDFISFSFFYHNIQEKRNKTKTSLQLLFFIFLLRNRIYLTSAIEQQKIANRDTSRIISSYRITFLRVSYFLIWHSQLISCKPFIKLNKISVSACNFSVFSLWMLIIIIIKMGWWWKNRKIFVRDEVERNQINFFFCCFVKGRIYWFQLNDKKN